MLIKHHLRHPRHLCYSPTLSKLRGNFGGYQLTAGLKTTEFWLTLATSTAAILMALNGVLPAQWAVVVTAIANGLYALARGWAKSSK